jgi:heme/copper-type cytochrome/quinol oxidase subunit 2
MPAATVQAIFPGSGVWQLQLLSAFLPGDNPPAVGISWQISGQLQPSPPSNDNWWTTNHIIMVCVALGVALIVLAILLAVVVKFCLKRQRFEQI